MWSMRNDPIALARKYGDGLVLAVTIIFILVGVLFAGWTGLLLAVPVILLGLIIVKIYQASYLGNALRLQNSRATRLNHLAADLAADLHLPYVDIYITQDPYLNAFAIGFIQPYTIVLHSAIVERLTADELRAVLVHEMGHIKYHHTVISSYLTPLISLLPGAGFVLQWVFGFWSRRAELACDRLALAYTGDFETVTRALIKVHVGVQPGELVDVEQLVAQARHSRTLISGLAESFQSHPFLVHRVAELIDFSQRVGLHKTIISHKKES